MTQEEMLAYEARSKRILDEEAALREAELRKREAGREGMEIGMEIGMEKGMELTARRLLEEGMDINFIARVTNLGKKRIKEIKDII